MELYSRFVIDMPREGDRCAELVEVVSSKATYKIELAFKGEPCSHAITHFLMAYFAKNPYSFVDAYVPTSNPEDMPYFLELERYVAELNRSEETPFKDKGTRAGSNRVKIIPVVRLEFAGGSFRTRENVHRVGYGSDRNLHGPSKVTRTYFSLGKLPRAEQAKTVLYHFLRFGANAECFFEDSFPNWVMNGLLRKDGRHPQPTLHVETVTGAITLRPDAPDLAELRVAAATVADSIIRWLT